MNLIECKTSDDFVKAAVDRILSAINHSEPPARIALSGGRTPLPVYRALARRSPDWDRVEFWLTDERFIPLAMQGSNYRAIRQALGKRAIIHPFDTDLQGRETIRRYAVTLPDRFDLVILGLGADGHTASLFADGRIVEEVTDKTAQIYAPSVGEIPDRLTLLSPVLLAAEKILFLVQGEAKKGIVKTLLYGHESMPARPFSRHPEAELIYSAG